MYSSFSLFAFLVLGSFLFPAAASDNDCANEMIVFLDHHVQEYVKHERLPDATFGQRATFFNGTVTQTSTPQRLDPTSVYKSKSKVFIETRVFLPLFRAQYKCKYTMIWEYPCPDVNITSRNAIGFFVLSYDEDEKVIEMEEMKLIQSENDFEVGYHWLRPLLSQLTDSRLKRRVSDTYKKVINEAHLKVPLDILDTCGQASNQVDSHLPSKENKLTVDGLRLRLF